MTREETAKILEKQFDESCGDYRYQNKDKLDYEDALWLAITALRELDAREKRDQYQLRPIDSYAGLKRKYVVMKADTGKCIENCFVLRPDKDKAAVVALRAYAEATDNKTLASDIINWVGPELNLPLPLTLDELRQMDGEPVWDDVLKEWCAVRMNYCSGKGGVLYFDGGINDLSEKRFYRHKPKEETK